MWKNIKGYNGLYKINQQGQIYSIKRKRLFKQFIVSGYFKIGLNKNNKRKFYFVHRLIAIYFIVNKNNKPCINHLDGNKLNNNINNLKWCTHKENTAHAIKNNLIKRPKGVKHHASKLTKKDVLYIINSNKKAKELAGKFNISFMYIYEIKSRKYWKHL